MSLAHALTKSPDDFAARTANDLYPHEIIALATIWPAAYEAVIELLLLADNGQVAHDCEDFDFPLPKLIKASEAFNA